MTELIDLFETSDMSKLKSELARLVQERDYKAINTLLRCNPYTWLFDTKRDKYMKLKYMILIVVLMDMFPIFELDIKSNVFNVVECYHLSVINPTLDLRSIIFPLCII